MTTSSVRGSAKIYEFPLRRRAQAKAVEADVPLVAGDFGSGWYHEAALREAEPARKR